MASNFTQKSVLITGCSKGGIEDVLVQSFYRGGLRVFATAGDLSKVDRLKEMGLSVSALDIVDATSLRNAVESVKKQQAELLIS
jgi:1-acylglycerone phosphate reductase